MCWKLNTKGAGQFRVLAALSICFAWSAPHAAHADDLLQWGLLDVTQPPYSADASGQQDSTAAIQRAVDDARDRHLACFFPEGTYLVSDTLSCEQQVEKLDRPRATDRGTQHYWDKSHRIIMIGSTKGKRPVLKLAQTAKGFDDPQHPKIAVHIWAQTRDDAPGKDEPEWGKEQPNISFSHMFKGIDIDIRGHAGAIGIRHSGSQGSTLQDSRILAEGAYAGMNNCPGQGGGTYNIEVLGGKYGIVIERDSRFPLLVSCLFEGQTDACVTYGNGGAQMPSLFTGCVFKPAGEAVVDLTPKLPYAGVSLIQCMADLPDGGALVKMRPDTVENVYIEDTYVRGAGGIRTGSIALSNRDQWYRIERFSSHGGHSANLINGELGTAEIQELDPRPTPPEPDALRARHYEPEPSFEDRDAVNVKAFGALGDGKTDDMEAFRKAIAASDKVFVPKGFYKLRGILELKPNTKLFAIARTMTGIGAVDAPRRGPGEDDFTLVTADDADAAPGLWFLSVHGRLTWRSGKGTIMLTAVRPDFEGHGGGRIYGAMGMGRQLALTGIRQPTSFYALNVERVTTNPQSIIEDCAHIRVYYFKVEAGSISSPNAKDGNTPCAIVNSEDVRVYCMYGVVRKLEGKPMIEVRDAKNIGISQVKAFESGPFPHIKESIGGQTSTLPASDICALYVRD